MTDNDALETIEYKEHTIKVYYDFDPQNPLDWDNAGRLVCWHSRYTLGDEQPKCSPEEWFRDILESQYRERVNDDVRIEKYIDKLYAANLNQLMFEFSKHNLIMPLYLYDHGGISISTRGFGGRAHHAEWDSGMVGFVYITHADILKEWGGKRIGARNMGKAVGCLRAEVSTYDDFLRGEVYGYDVTNPNGKSGDSCWGFYGDEGRKYMVDEVKSIIDHRLEKSGGVVEFYFNANDPGLNVRERHGGFETLIEAEARKGVLGRRNYQSMTDIIARKVGEGYIEEEVTA